MNETTHHRLLKLIDKARQPGTKAALTLVRRKPTRDNWLAAEKAAWRDVPLDTNDCLWLRAQALALPSEHSRGEEALDD